MILFLRFRRATLLLTRGMDRSLHHQQTLETELVGLRHQRGFAQPALPLGVLLGQDVPLVRVVAAQPTGPGEPDALAERALGFLFRHLNPQVSGVGCRVSDGALRAPDTWPLTPPLLFR